MLVNVVSFRIFVSFLTTNDEDANDMHLYSMPIIHEYGTRHAIAYEDLLIWAKQIRSANWKDFNALKEDFPSCDFIEDERYVFNIHGNKHRLVAMIFFKSQQLFIRGIFPHAEYTKLSKQNKLGSL